MGNRNSNQKKPGRLSIKKETLRALLRPLTDDALRVVAGGVSATCTLDNCEAPSCHRC